MNAFFKSFLKWLVSLTVISFLVWYLFVNFNKVTWSELDFDYSTLVLSFVILLVDYILLSSLWNLVLRKMGYYLPWLTAHKIFFPSLLSRYIPGKAVLVISRIYLGKKAGIDGGTIFTSIIIDTVLLLSSGTLCFLILLPFLKGLPNYFISLSLVLAIVLMIILHPFFLKSIVNLLLRVVKHDVIDIKLRYHQIISLVFLYSLHWILDGIAIFFLISSFYKINTSLLFFLPGIIGFSTVLSMISFITPGGLGVREGILVLLLSIFIPPHFAVLISLISRVWFTIAEILLAVVFQSLKKGH